MEHRWGSRFRIDIAVRLFADPASAAWGRLRDLSVSGGFIETRLPLAPLSTLCMMPDTTWPGSAGAQRVHAIVVRRDHDGVGVEWSEYNSAVIVALVALARTGRVATLRQPRKPLLPRAPG